MQIVQSEQVKLTDGEYDVLHQAYELLKNIRNNATDTNICNRADNAANHISGLLHYCDYYE